MNDEEMLDIRWEPFEFVRKAETQKHNTSAALEMILLGVLPPQRMQMIGRVDENGKASQTAYMQLKTS